MRCRAHQASSRSTAILGALPGKRGARQARPRPPARSRIRRTGFSPWTNSSRGRRPSFPPWTASPWLLLRVRIASKDSLSEVFAEEAAKIKRLFEGVAAGILSRVDQLEEKVSNVPFPADTKDAFPVSEDGDKSKHGELEAFTMEASTVDHSVHQSIEPVEARGPMGSDDSEVTGEPWRLRPVRVTVRSAADLAQH